MSPTKENLVLLIIENNEGDFILISESIEEIFPTSKIDWAPDFKSAIKKQGADYDAILLDLSLPDKSGEELIQEISSFASKIPVIVLTGYVDKSFAARSISLGVSDYLIKDELHPDVLYRSIIYSIERKKIFNQLEQSELRYKDIFHLSPLPMWVFEFESHSFLDVNEAAIFSYGYSKEEFLSMTIEDIRPKEDLIQLQESLKEETLHLGLKHAGTFRHRKKNGEVIFVEISINMIIFQGKPSKLVLANDVTQKRAHIETIELQNTKLREIAWVQSHIVRAPLARLIGLVNLLELDLRDLPQDKKELLEYIVASAEELDGIVKEINEKARKVNMPDQN
ncbi:MAG: PAS domain S-box protein [Cyclobacteriaceae bacterium]